MKNIDWVKWSSISEVISSIAILITLIYLAVQTQQNTESTNSQTRHQLFDAGLREFELWLRHPDLTLVMASNDLEATPEQKIRLDYLLTLALVRREFSLLQYNAGALDRNSLNEELAIIPVLLGTERSRDWWRKVGRGGFSDEFVAIVDPLIENQPYHPRWQNIVNW